MGKKLVKSAFVVRNGHVLYPHGVRSGKCEYGCTAVNTVLDHCHVHGWVRAEVCSTHNAWMRLIDLRIGEPCDYDPRQVNQARQCPDCNSAGYVMRVLYVEFRVARAMLYGIDDAREVRTGNRLGYTLNEVIEYALAGRPI